MRAGSNGERRLWRAAACLVVAIYASAYFVQFVLDFLRERNLLRLTIGAVFALVAAAAVTALARSGARWRAWSTLVLIGAAYAAAALALDVVQERIHLLEYGVLALVVRAALEARAAADPSFGFRSPPAASCGAFAYAFAAGAGDELIQWILPNRVGELSDVGLNAISGALALLATSAVELALAGDLRSAVRS